MKKIFLLILLLTLLVFSGCASEKPEASKATQTAIVAASPKITEKPTEAPSTPTPTQAPATPSPIPKPTYVPGSEAYSGGIASEDAKVYEAFDITTQDSEAVALAGEGLDTAALQFFATVSFNKIGLICPSYGNSVGTLTLSLHSWKGDYESTVESDPIATKEFVDFPDNSWLILDFDNAPDGEYVLLVSLPSENVGLWKTIDDYNGIRSYKNGEAVDGAYKSAIYYTKTPNTLWHELSDAD